MVIGGGNPLSPWAVCLATECFFSLCLDIVLKDTRIVLLIQKFQKDLSCMTILVLTAPGLGAGGRKGKTLS